MQTFVPRLTFSGCARALDYRRLGKQRVECLQILQALDPDYRPDRPRRGWVNHPAVVMWRGYEGALALYARAIVSEWVSRGYRDVKCGPQIDAYVRRHCTFTSTGPTADVPKWWGDDRVHRSHQSNLIRKLPDHYAPQFPGVPDDLPYVWP